MKTQNYKPFIPAYGLENAHLQTLYPTYFSNFQPLKTTDELFELSDGDFVECVWNNKPKLKSAKPIVVLFHGLTGNVHSPYIQRAMRKLGTNGFSVVLMQFRGCGKQMNSLPRSYHSGETEDAKAWIKELKNRYPFAPLFAIGYSLGGNMLLKLLGELQDNSPLTACISVSAPMQLEVSANKMNSGFSKIYQYHLMQKLKTSLLKKYKIHNMHALIKIDKNDVQKLNTFWEFDAAYTAPIHRFENASDYYTKSSAKQFLKDIKTPTLIIHALDDPFMTPEILPTEDELSSSVELDLYPHGGHIGFVGGTIFKPHYWLEERIVNYFCYTEILS